ncbi:MAG: hypothetical protein NDJ72_08940, partial [Elusimicrobia bacterium]|nr:hypothetical protein [Elusimicrobiota bacterium]
PFYYRREDRRTGARTVVTLLASRLRTPESTKWIVAPLLSSIAWGAGEKDVWALAGLARARWGGADRQSHLLPLYYHDSRQRLLLTPLYSSRHGPVGFKNWGLIAAHKDWTPEGEGLQILPPLAEFSRRGSRRVVRVLPFFSWTADGGARDLWVAPWIHLTSSGTARENRFFPFWSRVVKEGPGRKESSFRVLGWLFERRATTTAAGPPLVRTRVLWKVWDDRREGAARSIDCVPFISWDRRGDGSRRFSFLWRFIRWEAAADGRPSLDLLFIPVLRPPPH